MDEHVAVGLLRGSMHLLVHIGFMSIAHYGSPRWKKIFKRYPDCDNIYNPFAIAISFLFIRKIDRMRWLVFPWRYHAIFSCFINLKVQIERITGVTKNKLSSSLKSGLGKPQLSWQEKRNRVLHWRCPLIWDVYVHTISDLNISRNQKAPIDEDLE